MPIFTVEVKLSGIQKNGQTCVSQPIRADGVFRKGGLKEGGAKTERKDRAAALN